MIIVLLLRHKKSMGLTIFRCSYMYSSVARLKSISFDSACRMSMLSGLLLRNEGRLCDDVEKDLFRVPVTVRDYRFANFINYCINN
jgi:hypothetical protein